MTQMERIYALVEQGATRAQMIEQTGLSAKQVSKALSNLKWAGRIHISQRGTSQGRAKGTTPAQYSLVHKPKPTFVVRVKQIINSVWSLA